MTNKARKLSVSGPEGYIIPDGDGFIDVGSPEWNAQQGASGGEYGSGKAPKKDDKATLPPPQPPNIKPPDAATAAVEAAKKEAEAKRLQEVRSHIAEIRAQKAATAAAEAAKKEAEAKRLQEVRSHIAEIRAQKAATAAVEAAKKEAEAKRLQEVRIAAIKAEKPAKVETELSAQLQKAGKAISKIPSDIKESISKAQKDINAQKEIIDNWLGNVQKILKLTPADIKASKQQYLNIPEMPEAPADAKRPSARDMLAILVPTTSNEALDIPNAGIKEVFKKGLEFEKKKFETTLDLTKLTMSKRAPEIRQNIKEVTKGLPPVMKEVSQFGIGAGIGALEGPIYTAIVGGDLVKAAWAPDPVKNLKDVGKGMVDFFKSIPPTIAAEPALASGELFGLFVLGPEGALKVAKSIGIRALPHYIPTRGMGIEYSVVRIPAKIANTKAVITAVNQGITKAMKSKTGTAMVNIGDGSIKLKIKPTPVSEIVGPALYHATPALAKALKEGKVRGELYTSPHLAVRFAESSAKGTPQTNSAILMIHTKSGNVKWRPTTNLYKGTKELEAVYGNTNLEPVKSLWNRLTFGKAGDFVTTHNGEFIPIYRFKEPGATAPGINLSDLTAIRVKTVKAALADLAKGRKGIEIVRESVKAIQRRIEKQAKNEIKKGKTTTEAYTNAYTSEIRRLYSGKSLRLLERLFRENPEAFEVPYREHLAEEMTNLSRERSRRPDRDESKREEARDQEKERDREEDKERDQEKERDREEDKERDQEKERDWEEDKEREKERDQEKERDWEEDKEREKERVKEELQKPRMIPKVSPGIKTSEYTPEQIKSAVAYKLGRVVYAFFAPYQSKADVKVFSIKNVPAGLKVITLPTGEGSPQKSFQAIAGKLPANEIQIDTGIMDIFFSRRGLRFVPDRQRQTTGNINVKGVGSLRNISSRRGKVFTTKIKGGTILSRRAVKGL